MHINAPGVVLLPEALPHHIVVHALLDELAVHDALDVVGGHLGLGAWCRRCCRCFSLSLGNGDQQLFETFVVKNLDDVEVLLASHFKIDRNSSQIMNFMSLLDV